MQTPSQTMIPELGTPETAAPSLRLAPNARDPRPSVERRAPRGGLALPFSERRVLLTVVDLLMLNCALLIGLVIRPDVNILEAGAGDAIAWKQLFWFALLSALWLVVGSLLDLYDLARAASPVNSVPMSIGAAALTMITYLFIPYITPPLPSSRIDALALPLLAAACIGPWRLFYATVFVQPNFCQRTLVIGTGKCARTLVRALRHVSQREGNPYHGTGYQIQGFVDDQESKIGTDVDGIPVLGTHRDLVWLAREMRPHELILAIPSARPIEPELFQAMLDCQEMGISVSNMTTIYERLTGRVPIEHAGCDPSVVLPMDQSVGRRLYLVGKRLADLLVGVVGCVTSLLILPFVWLANLIWSAGPLFYWQERMGKGGKSFAMVKFRSMVVDAEELTGPTWARNDDSRVTPVGRFLRWTRLDEIPQSWNILKGEMSLIGPRPERPHFVQHLTGQVPYYRVRHAVRPGLTGWAQVRYHYGASLGDAWMKLQYDLYYIKHQGLALDVQILFMTIGVVLGLKGR